MTKEGQSIENNNFVIRFIGNLQRNQKYFLFLYMKKIFVFYISVVLTVGFLSILSACKRDEPGEPAITPLTSKEDTQTRLMATAWVLQGIYMNGTNLLGFNPSWGVANQTLQFKKDNLYTAQPASGIFSATDSWVIKDERNVLFNLAHPEGERAFFIMKLTTNELIFQHNPDPNSTLTDDLEFRWQKK